MDMDIGMELFLHDYTRFHYNVYVGETILSTKFQPRPICSMLMRQPPIIYSKKPPESTKVCLVRLLDHPSPNRMDIDTDGNKEKEIQTRLI